MEDNVLIVKKLESLASLSSGKKTKLKLEPADNFGAGGAAPEKGFEHTVASGDTLSTIVQAYKKKGIKVTVDQILKVNPGLVPEKMKVGQKIFIPAPEK